MNYVSRVAAFALIFVALLTWALQRSFSYGQGYGRDVAQITGALELADNRLLKDVLLTRAGLLQNYDPLVLDINDLRASARDLETRPGPWREEAAEVSRVVAAKEDALERFKTENALLQNSLAYFDLADEKIANSAGDPAFKLAVAGLASAVTHLLRDPSDDNARSVASRLEVLRGAPFATNPDASSLRRHGELLVDAIPATNTALVAIQENATAAAVKRIRDAIERKQTAMDRKRLVVDAGLYGGSFVFFLLLMRTLALLHRDGEALRYTVIKERLAFESSSLFIACPPEQVATRMEEMMRLLGKGYGCTSVYLLLLDEPRRIIAWHKIPPREGWPTALFDFVPELSAMPIDAFRIPYDDVSVSQELREAIAAADVPIWSCVKVRDGLHLTGLLCFDRSISIPVGARATHENLLLHANVVNSTLLRLRMYRKRSELEMRLRKAERLGAVGTFTTGVAHNFNNLVGAIVGQAEMAIDLLPPEHRAVDHIRRLLQTSSRAQEVASQILDFGRVGGGVRKEVAVVPLVRETVALIEAGPGSKGITVEVEDGASQAAAWADPGRLQQVFHNVILNAVQASPEGARVQTAVDAPMSGDRPLARGRLRAGRYVRVSVRDTGRGMDAATKERVFEPFFTTRPTGTGLGLATAFETLRELGGGIELDSTPGQGTTMTLWMPARRPAGDARAAPVGPTGLTVMIVNTDRRAILRDEELLASLGFEPVGFPEVAAALEALRRDAGRFDVLIVEEAMSPEMQSFLREARACLPTGRRIVMSSPQASIEAAALEAFDVYACIGRPWHPALVASTLHEALRG